MTPLARTPAEQPVHYLRLAAAAKAWPGSIHPASLVRHILKGVKLRNGTRLTLWALRTTGGWVTTHAAIDEFIDAITRDRCGDPSTPAGDEPRPPASRRKAIDAAERELERAGV